ncbi:hypothetical protein ACH5RR_028160 [Cinchona calisaya]|uniref:Uncharacterized protein n=1 Tax=Cinchona calisaya TaxID=153742 RepID=A0ABD2YPY1_9GENT
MAKAVAIVSAICFLALASFATAQLGPVFNVEGEVYCDPCRVEFQTSLSKGLEGAAVRLECRERDTGVVTIQSETVTGKDGKYNLKTGGDHEEEICEVVALKSPSEKCNVSFERADSKARVLLTQNNGVQGTDRYANALGFKTAQADEECKAVLEELGIVPEDI